MDLKIIQQLYYWFAALVFRIGSKQYLENVPQKNTLTMNIVLQTDRTKYMLDQYQRLDNTLLLAMRCPYDADLTKSLENLDIASRSAFANAYVCLIDTVSNRRYEDVPLLDLIRDQTYMPNKAQFHSLQINWRQSYIKYPDNTIPNANNNKVVQIVVDFVDYSNPEGFSSPLPTK